MHGSSQKLLLSFRSNKQPGRQMYYSDWPNSIYFYFQSNLLFFTKLCRNDSWMVLRKYINLRSDWTRKWQPNGLFWLDGSPQIYYFSFWLNNQDGRQVLFSILIGQFSIIVCSETTVSNITQHNVWMVLNNNTTFHSGWTNNMATRANSLFWLADFQKSSSLKLHGLI